jgi:hypothetical protein
MTTRIRKVITAIDTNGNAFSEQHTETQVGDKWVLNDPTPLDNTTAWGEQYSAILEAENTTLKTAKTTLETDLASKTTDYNTNKEVLDKLTADHTQLVAAHKTALDEKEAALTAANATIAALEARLERLLTALPFNPREISVAAFKARLFSVLETEDVVRLYAAQPDSTLEQIAATITTWDHAYSIRLDSVELLNPLGYLVAISLLTSDEVAFLRRDCTLPEAFVAPI